jgi:hypothetical protein
MPGEGETDPMLPNTDAKPEAGTPESKVTLWMLLGFSPSPESVYVLNACTFWMHAANLFIVSLVVTNLAPKLNTHELDDTVGPYFPAVCFDRDELSEGRPPFQIEQETFADPRTYLLALVYIFFGLSVFFQMVAGASKAEYIERLQKNGVNEWRYLEYSLSASVMMVAIACSLMIYDGFTHILVFLCTMLCMMLGLVSDYLRYLGGTMLSLQAEHAKQRRSQNTAQPAGPRPAPAGVASSGDSDEARQDDPEALKTSRRCIRDICYLKWATHALSWVALFVPYLFVFMVSYIRSSAGLWKCSETAEEQKARAAITGEDVDTAVTPALVHVVIVSQFLLYACFGLVQLRQFCSGAEPRVVGTQTEYRFVVLSLVSKTLLGWLIVASAIIA